MSGLNIRKDPCELDFLSFGALVHRLDPGVIPFRKARSFDIHVSGGEYNVAANSSRLLRPARPASPRRWSTTRSASWCRAGCAKPASPRSTSGSSTTACAGRTSPRSTATAATACAPPVVFYNRANEAGALLKPGDFDWAKIFAGGVRWFHSGGIFAALSETTVAADHRRHASRQGGRRHQLLRPQLPGQALGRRSAASPRPAGHPDRSSAIVDALVGNEEDLQKGLGITGPEVVGKSKLDPDAFFVLIDRVVEQLPNIKLVATTLREVHSTNRHDWAAVLWLDGKRYVSPTTQLDVVDRIGGGDGFAAGLIYGLIAGRSPEEALRLGWAHGALLTTFPGDVTMARSEEVEAFAKGGSARVQR